jgi:hypothetical protein
MNIALTWRAQLEKVPGGHWIVQSLNNLITGVTDSYHTQHNTDDTHADITATSVLSATMGAPINSGGTFTQQTGYTSPSAVRWIFGDGTGWKAIWSAWKTTPLANVRNPAAQNLTDLMSLTDTGVLAPVSVSGPSGVLGITSPAPAAGGGAGATLTTIGGSGPTSAGQAGWIKVTVNGTTAYLPYWT